MCKKAIEGRLRCDPYYVHWYSDGVKIRDTQGKAKWVTFPCKLASQQAEAQVLRGDRWISVPAAVSCDAQMFRWSKCRHDAGTQYGGCSLTLRRQVLDDSGPIPATGIGQRRVVSDAVFEYTEDELGYTPHIMLRAGRDR
jgi:hypothetical protein